MYADQHLDRNTTYFLLLECSIHDCAHSNKVCLTRIESNGTCMADMILVMTQPCVSLAPLRWLCTSSGAISTPAMLN